MSKRKPIYSEVGDEGNFGVDETTGVEDTENLDILDGDEDTEGWGDEGTESETEADLPTEDEGPVATDQVPLELGGDANLTNPTVQRMLERIAKKREQLAADQEKLAVKIEKVKAKSEKVVKVKAEKPIKVVAEPASVPEMFPRNGTLPVIWDTIRAAAVEEDGITKVTISINAIARDFGMQRATVKNAVHTLVGGDILTDLTPTLNAAHTYELRDPFPDAGPAVEVSAPVVGDAFPKYGEWAGGSKDQ